MGKKIQGGFKALFIPPGDGKIWRRASRKIRTTLNFKAALKKCGLI